MALSQAREEALVALTLEKPPTKRAAFLDVICEGDAGLRRRLEALVVAREQAESLAVTQLDATPFKTDGSELFQHDPAATSAKQNQPTQEIEFTDTPDEAIGQTLGRYKLLEKVGEGGCGVVYVAEQTEPVRRRVALKVIKLGMDTKAVVARFEAER